MHTATSAREAYLSPGACRGKIGLIDGITGAKARVLVTHARTRDRATPTAANHFCLFAFPFPSSSLPRVSGGEGSGAAYKRTGSGPAVRT